jgi:transposase
LGSKIVEKKLQFAYKKTRLMPGKLPSEDIQNEFVSWYENAITQAMEEKIHLLFYDPVHQLHNTINQKCWQAKGGANTVVLQSNTGRKRITILGAINPVNYDLTSIVLEGMVDKDVTNVAIKNIRENYSDGKKVIIIMDNAKYNRAYQVQDYAKSLNIEIKFLPPYAPNLNLIERVWKFLKSKLKNKYIENFEDFREWIMSFCKNFKNYENEITKIISSRIQILKAV